MFGVIDPFGTGFGDSSPVRRLTPPAHSEPDNSVLYQSPSWGGFKFGVGYSFNASGAENWVAAATTIRSCSAAFRIGAGVRSMSR